MRLGIYDMEQTYDSDLEALCESSTMLQVMHYYEISHPALYLNAAPSLHLYESNENHTGYNIRFNAERLLQEYRENYHAGIVEGKDTEEIYYENMEKVKEGIPVIAGVDVYYLPYAPYYQAYHSNHRIILSGDPEDNGEIPIIDCYEWKYKGTMLRERLLEARASLCPKDESLYSGYPVSNEWSWLDSSGWQAEAPELLRATIRNSLHQFYETGQSSGGGHYYGIAAMKKIVKLLGEWKESETESKILLMEEMRGAFHFLYIQLKFFRYYIGESAKCMEIPLLTDLHQGLVQDLGAYSKAVALIAKYKFRTAESGYERIRMRIGDLIRMEEKRLEKLTLLNNILQTN